METRVRFAPSPTGYVHIGGLRTALYNYLYAKKNDGKYILRVEDTDRTRLVEGAIEGMIDALGWAGLIHDEGPFLNESGEIFQKGEFGPYIQSQRNHIYEKYAQELVDSGNAYYCFCSKERLEELRESQKASGATPKYDGHCRDLSKEEALERIKNGEKYVIRLKLPENRDIVFDDLIRGRVSVNTNDIDDQVLVKTDGFPTYHLAVIVDDHHMGITHVVRGEEWLISTPKHVFTYEAFGWEAPTFVHLPVILNKSKKKLSKREGDVAVEDFKKKGYLPEALINYIALVGWSPEGNEEILSMDDMVEKFSFDRVSKSSGVFDVDKLNWINNHYIKEAELKRIVDLSIPYLIEKGYVDEADVENKYEWIENIVSLMRERLNFVSEITDHMDLFISENITLENQEAKEMIEMDHVKGMIEVFIEKFKNLENFDDVSIKKSFKEVQKEMGIKGKNLFMCMRVAITGQVHGPDLNKTIQILGRELSIRRLENAVTNMCK